MTGKFHLIGALAGAIVLFLWGFIWNAALPFHDSVMTEFADPAAVNQTIAANTSGNGVYYTVQGVVAAVSFLPDMPDKSTNMTMNLVTEFIVGLIVAFLLSLLYVKCKSGASAILLAALAACFAGPITNWNWYGVAMNFVLFTCVGMIIGWLLVAIVFKILAKKYLPAT